MVWIEYDTHRGQTLYYSSTDPRVYYTPLVVYPSSTEDNLIWNIDQILGPEEPEHPDPQVDYVEATHKDIEIWWKVGLGVFWAQVAAGYVAVGATVLEVEGYIDEILAFLEPVEDPGEGLFAQVVASVKAWVLQNLPGWVSDFGRVINNFVTNTTEYVTNTVNNLTHEITNVLNNTTEYISNVYNDTYEYITNVSQYVTEQITNTYNNTYEYITNVIGITQENLSTGLSNNRDWVRSFFVLMDPMEFLRDPTGFINAAFNVQREITGTDMIKSFWEGFEEGLEE